MSRSIFFIVIIICRLCFVYTTTVYFKAHVVNSGKIHYTGALVVFGVNTLTFCLQQCYNNKKCMTIFYNRHTKGCVLHSKTFKYSVPEQEQDGWKFYLLVVTESRCPSDINGFMHYRHLNLCYNFNPEHYIDYPGHIQQTCSSYGGELLRIDSQERQLYIEHILEGRTTTRVAIQGHSYNPGFAWTLYDGTPLPYTNWRSGGPQIGQYYLQIFYNDFWTEQNDLDVNRNNMFLCERRP